MTRGQRVGDGVRHAIIQMSHQLMPQEISDFIDLPLRTVQHILKQASEGTVFEHHPQPKRGSYKLSDDDMQFLIALIHRTPDIYLSEMKDSLLECMGKEVSISTIYRALRRAGFTRKTITKAARERDDLKRAQFRARIAKYLPHERVYIDESRFDRRTSIRSRAWAFKGERALSKVFFLRGKSYSVLPALSLDGVIHVKIVENAFNTITFNEFVAELIEKMNPYDEATHPKNSVLIMDNCRIHKDPEMVAMVQARGIRVEYLSPYSPDYNPIELCFSSMKKWIQKNNNLARDAWGDRANPNRAVDLLVEMTEAVTRANAFGWFQRAGVL